MSSSGVPSTGVSSSRAAGASPQGPDAQGGGPTRRHLLKLGAAAIAVSITPMPRPARAEAPVASAGAAQLAAAPEVPGVATRRIDGRDKVMGRKIFARDFNARDMAGWPAAQWHAVFLPALSTEHVFEGIDLAGLPEGAQPVRVVLGDALSAGMRAPRLRFRRDPLLAAEQAAAERRARAAAEAQAKTATEAKAAAEATAETGAQPETDAQTGTAPRTTPPAETAPQASFNDPTSGISYDLLVVPGNVPNYLGQAVALLLFDSAASARAAARSLAFDDPRWQRYGQAIEPSPDMGQPFPPLTDYVKYGDLFSYATAEPDSYTPALPDWRARIARSLAQAPELIRQPVAASFQAMDPMFMEPEAGLAWLDPASATLNLVLGTQSPDGDIENIAGMYADPGAPVALKAVALTSCYPGGGFGGRDGSPFSLMLALAAGFTDGRPVRLALDRFDQFRTGIKRHAAEVAGEIAVAPDMTLRCIGMKLRFDGGGRKNLSPYVAQLAAICAGGAYRLPMADIAADAVHTQNVTAGSQRGFGGPQAFFALETALDDLAITQGWDPLALRRANIMSPEDTTVVGGPVAQELRLGEILEIIAAHPLWRDRAAIRAAHAAAGRHYGTGVALSMQAYGTSGDGMVASVALDAQGRVQLGSDAVDMGNGSATTLGVVVGPILGANASAVVMGNHKLWGQTGLTTEDPEGKRWDNPTWTAAGVGSSSACLTALHQVHVAQQAAIALRAVMLVAAGRLWGRPAPMAEEIRWEGGTLLHHDATLPALPLAKIAQKMRADGLPTGALVHGYFQGSWSAAGYPLDFAPGGALLRLEADGLAWMRDGQAPAPVARQQATGPDAASQRRARYVWAPCANVVGLTVEPATGAVRIENVLSVLNAGRIHVPELVSGQSQGGVAMAVGYTLLEDMPPGMAGPAGGGWNLDRYHVPRSADLPLETRWRPGGRAQELVVLRESPGDGRAGRGIAEAVMCALPPAISNALREATGQRFASLPITPDKILRAWAAPEGARR